MANAGSKGFWFGCLLLLAACNGGPAPADGASDVSAPTDGVDATADGGTSDMDTGVAPICAGGSEFVGLEYQYPGGMPIRTCLSLGMPITGSYDRSGGTCVFGQTIIVAGARATSATITSRQDIFAMTGTVQVPLVIADGNNCPVASTCSFRATECTFRVTQAGSNGSTVQLVLDSPCTLAAGPTDQDPDAGTILVTNLTAQGPLDLRTFDSSNPDAMPTPCR
jgi:hypothetical protein